MHSEITDDRQPWTTPELRVTGAEDTELGSPGPFSDGTITPVTISVT